MRKRFTKLLPILLLFCSLAHGVTAHVQSATPATGVCNTTCTIALTGVGANTVVLGVLVESSTTITVNSVSDGTNSFTKTAGSPCSSAAVNGRQYIWQFTYGSAPGNRTFTITVSGSVTITRLADEFSGASGTMDVEACGVDVSPSTAISTPSITPTVTGGFLYAACTVGATITVKTGSWTADTVTNGNDAEWQANVGTSAVAVGFTQNASNDWSCISTAWKASGAATKTCTLSLMGAGPC